MDSLSAELLGRCGSGDEAAVRCLIEQGANVHATDEDGDGVLRYAIGPRNLDLFEFLLKSGASASAPSTDLSGERGNSIIHAVAAAGWTGALRLLLIQGADPNARALSGQRPLMGAAARGSVSSIEMLGFAGADLNAVDGEGDTALYCAASKAQLGAVVALCELGAAVDVLPNVFGHTALSVAATIAYDSSSTPEDHEISLRIAKYLARNGASPSSMYGHGYVFGRSAGQVQQIVPL
ncbi:ankyrin repeat domain-containing protein [Brevibacterium aurantiacum]|uniref:ankyrin repeat domain-containing protein n=1 Tax=Brevibacterium aurantiacum TaxID=273384 RepID=UPI003F8DC520